MLIASSVIYWYLNCLSMRKLQFETLDLSELDTEILMTTGYPSWKDYMVTYFLMLFTLIAVIGIFFSIRKISSGGTTVTVITQLLSIGFFVLIGRPILKGESKFLYDEQLYWLAAGLMVLSYCLLMLYAFIELRPFKKKKRGAERAELRELRDKTNITVLDRCTLTVGDIDFSAIDKLGNTSYYDILSKEDMISACADADAVLCNKAVFDAEIMDACPRLKYIGLFATGYNNIDIAAAKERGITVCNVPGYSTDSVAQLVFAYILERCTSLSEYNESTHNGEWIKSSAFSYFPYPITELKGKYIGIIGYGAIGKQVAKLADAFGMRVYIATRTKPVDCPYYVVSVDEAFEVADFLTIHCPLTDKTKELVSAERLSKMKKTAYLINTSRGGVVDEAALRAALDSGVISGAAVDVLTSEPMKADNPLIGAKNLTITPHIAWASVESRVRLIKHVADNLSAYQSGVPHNVVS